MMDTTLPTPVTFNTAAMISSTPAVTDHEEERASHDIHDGSYISATNISATNSMCYNFIVFCVGKIKE